MKNLKILFSIFIVSMLTSSCENDDPLAKVKYQITGLDINVAQIKYTNALGGTKELLLNGDITMFAGGSDSKTIDVNFIPFAADLEVTVNNTSANVKNYTLVIYADGEPKATTNLAVPANTISTGTVEYLVEN